MNSSNLVFRLFFILVFISGNQGVIGCEIEESSVFIIHGESVVPDSGTACFNSCHSAGSNCTGVIFQGDKCVNIDKSNYFGQLPEVNYIEKNCLKKVVHKKLLVTEWNDRVLVDHTQRIVKANNKIQCLGMCANEKDFPCVSVMFYPEGEDCLLNSASSTSAKLKMDTEGYEVSYMELHGLKEPVHCLNAYKIVPYNEIEIRGETKLFDGTGGLQKCISRCSDCDFIIYNEIFSECFLVNYDITGQVLDFINDEYQILANACSEFKKDCSSQKAIYISYQTLDNQLKNRCLEMCTVQEDCQFAYQSENLTDCIITKRKMALPLVTQKVCGDTDDLPDGSAILFDQIGGCKDVESGRLYSKDKELYECMEACTTHPTKSCESISYTKSRSCYLNEGSVELDSQNSSCTVFTLNVITFETGTQTRTPPLQVKATKKPAKTQLTEKPGKAKTFASGNGKEILKIDAKKLSNRKSKPVTPSTINVRINTQCNFGDISVKVYSSNIKNGEVFVRNGHAKCSAKIDSNGEAMLKIKHNDTGCPMTQIGDIYQTVVVVSQNIGNSTVITIDDQFFKVRCDYSNQKKTTVTAKTMNLRTSTFSSLGINGNVKIKPMSMELRAKRETVKAQSVVLGQSLDLIFKSPLPEGSKSRESVFIRRCLAFDNNGEEKLVLVNNGCATPNAKEYVLRGEIEETEDGFSLPFRAFRFKQGEAVRIECEVKHCKRCKKPSCNSSSSRNRRYIQPSSTDSEPDHQTDQESDYENVHAELLVKESKKNVEYSEFFESTGYCVGYSHFIILTAFVLALLVLQIVILGYFCFRKQKR